MRPDPNEPYDGWNLLAVLNATNYAVVRSFLWGSDLSGSLQGAGGVGGLLAVNDAANGAHFAAYDGNGNLTALVQATDGTVSASYEYGPFGELIRATGPMAKANPFRFSTKFQDDETGLLYYGYRYYSAGLGRWLSRDPSGERGGKNLYGFVLNSPITRHDILGRVCAPMEVTDLGHKPAYTNWFPDGHGERKGGSTTLTSWVMSPVVEKCFPGFFSTCQHKVRIRACWSSINYWWDTEDDKSHELQHVNTGVNNWNALLAVVDGLVDKCVSERKARCYQSAIAQYSDYFYFDYWATGYELDCSDSGDPNSDFCKAATDYRNRANDASTKASSTLQRCEATP